VVRHLQRDKSAGSRVRDQEFTMGDKGKGINEKGERINEKR
jgi:hypothetical protein